jgi:hypothetical protein
MVRREEGYREPALNHGGAETRRRIRMQMAKLVVSVFSVPPWWQSIEVNT